MIRSDQQLVRYLEDHIVIVAWKYDAPLSIKTPLLSLSFFHVEAGSRIETTNSIPIRSYTHLV